MVLIKAASFFIPPPSIIPDLISVSPQEAKLKNFPFFLSFAIFNDKSEKSNPNASGFKVKNLSIILD